MEGGCVHIAGTAKERKGLQPVITLSANGRVCAHVKAGEKVVLRAEAQVPEGAGSVTEIQFSFSDPMFGTYARRGNPEDYHTFMAAGRSDRVQGELESFVTEDGRNGACASVTASYDRPGTYFATAFVKAQRNRDGNDVFTQVKNLARVRIIAE